MCYSALNRSAEKKIKEEKTIKKESCAVCRNDKAKVNDGITSYVIIDDEMDDKAPPSSTVSFFGNPVNNNIQMETATLILCPVSVINNWIVSITLKGILYY